MEDVLECSASEIARKDVLQDASGSATDELERTSIPAQSTNSDNTTSASGDFSPRSAASSNKRRFSMMFEDWADNNGDMNQGDAATKREKARDESVWTDVQGTPTVRRKIIASSRRGAAAGSSRTHPSSGLYCTDLGCERSAVAATLRPFKDQGSLDYHEKIAHNPDGQRQHVCLQCTDFRWFSCAKDLHRHLTNTHGSTISSALSPKSSDIGSRPICRLCGKDFKRASDLNRHMSQAHEPKLFMCPIPGCARAADGFGRKDKLRSHLRLKHRLTIPNGAPETDFLRLWKEQIKSERSERKVSEAHATNQASGALTPQGRRFACPYFKYSPLKSSIKRSCIGPGFADIQRVKEHLYRRHEQPIRCARCMAPLSTNSDFTEHLQSALCPISDVKIDRSEGFDREQKERIRLKTRRDAGASDDERWREIYHILFPEVVRESIPSPYQEPGIEQESLQIGSAAQVGIEKQSLQTGSASQVLERYQDHLARELPQRVRRGLEEIVDSALLHFEDRTLNSMEDGLKAQLGQILRTSLAELFESYSARPEAAIKTPEYHPGLVQGTSLDSNLGAPDLFDDCIVDIDDDLHFTNLIEEFNRGVDDRFVPSSHETRVSTFQSSDSGYCGSNTGARNETEAKADAIIRYHYTPVAEQLTLPPGLTEYDQDSFGFTRCPLGLGE